MCITFNGEVMRTVTQYTDFWLKYNFILWIDLCREDISFYTFQRQERHVLCLVTIYF